jgi:hypothetical protein
MAHPEEEAIDVQPADNDAAAIDAFDNILADEDEEHLDGDLEEGDELDPDDPEAEDDEELDDPVIPAPVSFNADEKAVFATMTPEQQQSVAAIEARRNAQVQQVTTEAAEAKRTARTQATSELAEIQRSYADHLKQLTQAFEPQEPDYSLLATDPQLFGQQLAHYKTVIAHREQLAKQAADVEAQANENERTASAEQQKQNVAYLQAKVPEWRDPAKFEAGIRTAVETGVVLGFTHDAMSQAEPDELLALVEASGWRDKAVKYDKLMSEKMSGVRSHKGAKQMSARPGTAQPKGSGQRRALTEATSRLRQSGSDSDAMAAFEAMGL